MSLAELIRRREADALCLIECLRSARGMDPKERQKMKNLLLAVNQDLFRLWRREDEAFDRLLKSYPRRSPICVHCGGEHPIEVRDDD